MSDYQILLSKIPNVVRSAGTCANFGTPVGAIAVSECSGLHGLAAGTIFYYLFSNSAALSNGFSTFLENEKFSRQSECTSNNIVCQLRRRVRVGLHQHVTEHDRQHCRVCQ